MAHTPWGRAAALRDGLQGEAARPPNEFGVLGAINTLQLAHLCQQLQEQTAGNTTRMEQQAVHDQLQGVINAWGPHDALPTSPSGAALPATAATGSPGGPVRTNRFAAIREASNRNCARTGAMLALQTQRVYRGRQDSIQDQAAQAEFYATADMLSGGAFREMKD